METVDIDLDNIGVKLEKNILLNEIDCFIANYTLDRSKLTKYLSCLIIHNKNFVKQMYVFQE